MINQVKELLIFLIISVVLITSVCLFPGIMIYNVFHTEGLNPYSNDELTSDLNNIFEDNVDNSIKKSVVNILINAQERNSVKMTNMLNVSVYYSILLSSIYILIGVYLYKKYGDTKLYLAQSFIFSGILLVISVTAISRFIILNYI